MAGERGVLHARLVDAGEPRAVGIGLAAEEHDATSLDHEIPGDREARVMAPKRRSQHSALGHGQSPDHVGLSALHRAYPLGDDAVGVGALQDAGRAKLPGARIGSGR